MDRKKCVSHLHTNVCRVADPHIWRGRNGKPFHLKLCSSGRFDFRVCNFRTLVLTPRYELFMPRRPGTLLVHRWSTCTCAIFAFKLWSIHTECVRATSLSLSFTRSGSLNKSQFECMRNIKNRQRQAKCIFAKFSFTSQFRTNFEMRWMCIGADVHRFWECVWNV